MLATLTVSATAVSLVLGFFLPIVNGFLIRTTMAAAVKVSLGIVVAGVAALLSNAIQADGSAVLSADMLVTFALVYGAQIAAYLGVWKPVDINERTGPGLPIG